MSRANSNLKNLDDLNLVYLEKGSNSNSLWYLFDVSSEGYIIISGDKRAYPIIGYSRNASISDNPTNFPPALAEFLKARSEELENIKEFDTEKSNPNPDIWNKLLNNTFSGTEQKTTSVEPLLQNTWNQGCYYNELCPEDTAGACGRAYAGCVATSMSQIMHYWRYPETGYDSNTYYHPDYDYISANFGNTTYLWDEMTAEIGGSNLAIATLLFHAGVSVWMNYGTDGSGASSYMVPGALNYYFKYSSEAELKNKNSYSDNAWKGLLRANLDKKYPLYYSGMPTEGSGHAFVCDGYEGDDFFHFDWGWSGSYNGYFYIDNLTPGGNNFNYNQNAVFDIFPPTASYPTYCQGEKTLTSTKGSFTDGSGNVQNYQPNSDCSWHIKPNVPVDNIVLSFK